MNERELSSAEVGPGLQTLGQCMDSMAGQAAPKASRIDQAHKTVCTITQKVNTLSDTVTKVSANLYGEQKGAGSLCGEDKPCASGSLGQLESSLADLSMAVDSALNRVNLLVTGI